MNPEKESSLTLDWDRVRVFDREIAQMFLNITKMAKEAKVRIFTKCQQSHISYKGTTI